MPIYKYAVIDLSQKGGVEYVNTCMQELFTQGTATQGRTVQKGGSNPPNPPANHTLQVCQSACIIAYTYVYLHA